MQCPYCMQEVAEGAFCGHCGRSQRTATQVVTPPPSLASGRYRLVHLIGEGTEPALLCHFQRLQRFGFHAQPTTLVLTFSTLLDPTRAQDVRNYRLVCPHGRTIRITKAVYDPTANAVTLRPAQRLPLHESFVLTVNGMAPNGLTSATGVLLDQQAGQRLVSQHQTRLLG